MKESNFQSEFSKRNTLKGVFELKFCKGTSLPFSSVAEHQEEALLAASGKGKGLFHKISDSPIFSDNKTRFTRPKPFDCFLIREYPAYVVIMWWVPRKKKRAYYIHINDWIILKETAERKSITEKMAEESCSLWEDYSK